MPSNRDIIVLTLALLGAVTLCAWIVRTYRKLGIQRLLQNLGLFERGPEVFPLMTREAAFQYYVTDRPADPRIKHGAILLESHEAGFLFTQVFLDSRYNLVLQSNGQPYGRRVIVRELDHTLKTAFSRKKSFNGNKVLFIPGVSRLLATSPDVSVMTYADALAYFSAHSPPHKVSKGAILLKRGIQKHIFQQVFLDEHDALVCAPGGKPYGRQCYVTRLDEKLSELFANRNVCIIQESNTPEAQGSPTAKRIQVQLPDHREIPTNAPQPLALTHQPRNGEPNHASPATPSPATKHAIETKPSAGEHHSASSEDLILTYKAAMAYFVTERPADLRIKKGAIRLTRHRRGYIIEQIFLDAQSEPVRGPRGKPYGRSLHVKNLDQELWDTFGSKQLIIVE